MTCLYCGGTEKLGTEHLVPRARGGLDIPENIFQACKKCNSSKGNRLPSEWRDDLSPEIYDLERRALGLHPKVPPRKKRDTQVLKEETINVRCTEQQKELLEEIAASQGMGVSTWLLYLGLTDANRRKQEDRR